MPDDRPRPLLLYDGVCGLCDRSIRFILRHEADARLHFAPLQGEHGARELAAIGLDAGYRESVLYIDEAGRAFSHSNAVWHAARHLRSPWRFAAMIRVIPRPLRDLGYRLVSAVRFKLFGHADTKGTCSVLPPDQRRRVHL